MMCRDISLHTHTQGGGATNYHSFKENPPMLQPLPSLTHSPPPDKMTLHRNYTKISCRKRVSAIINHQCCDDDYHDFTVI
jgi:hypothetical protein